MKLIIIVVKERMKKVNLRKKRKENRNKNIVIDMRDFENRSELFVCVLSHSVLSNF